MYRYLRSAGWLIGCGGIGYVLLEMTKPSEEKLRAIRNVTHPQVLRERDQKKALFMQKLSEAAGAGAKPVYLKTTAELEEENRRNTTTSRAI